MKELDYPFSAERIIANRKSLRRELLRTLSDALPVKIAILGGSTTSNIKQVLELFLLNDGIRPEFYESEYNRYYEDAVFQNEKLAEFAPDIIYIFTTNRNITRFPKLSDTEEAVEEMLAQEFGRYEQMWTQIEAAYHATIIQNNFEPPIYRLLGNRDAYDIHGAVNYISRLNMRFSEYARSHKRFHICDLNYLAADYGLRKWSDPFYWYMYKYAVAVPAIPYLSFNIANIIKSLLGKNKKGLVCDLDNTLWGGVIGEDGLERISLGPEDSEGQAYLAFQEYIKAQKQLGAVLCIDSKNDLKNALEGLNHPDGVLKADDFACIKANWDRKDQNFQVIADELSLLPESLVFLDDNPAERRIVTEQFPGVRAPELTDIAHYIEIVDRSGFFEAAVISEEDRRRAAMYEENGRRAKARMSFPDYGAYLTSLKMKAEIKPFEAANLPRIVQLTNKTNQFNLTTRRYSEPEMENVASNPEYVTLSGRLTDRFGDNGIVSLIIGCAAEGVCRIDLWLMSCRVLKRNMEFAMMDALAAACLARDITEIHGYYRPTPKNHMVENFYGELGFVKAADLENGGTEWILDLSQGYENKNQWIAVEEDYEDGRSDGNT